MTARKIAEVVAMYRERLEREGIPKRRIPEDTTFGSHTIPELLAHAHYLLDGIIEYSMNPERKGKTGRHLGSVQTILGMANWYTLKELQEHNRPN